MKKEQVLKLMDAVGPDLIEEADLQAPAKHRMPKAVRTGLIAACLCLALLGTAFAAANPEAVADFLSRFTPVQAESCTTEDGVNRYYVKYKPTGYPIDSFSPALLAAGENRGDDRHVELSFDTWAEARAFIGEDIPLFLPETGQEHSGLFDPETDQEQSGLFEVCLDYDEKDRLIRVEVRKSWTAPWFWVTITTEYFSGDATGTTGWGMVIESASGDSAQAEILEPYSMANGCQAEIALFILPADPELPNDVDSAHCIASFVQDGIQYSIHGGGLWPDGEWLSELYDMLDLFP